MKATFLKSFMLLAVLSLLMVGCGKDNKSSGGGQNQNQNQIIPQAMNPQVNPNLSAAAQQALANLRAWYANGTESGMPLYHRGEFVKEVKSISNFNFDFNFSFCFFGAGNCSSQTSPTHCYIRSGDGVNYDIGTPGANYTCNVTQSVVTKASNADLTAAVNGAGLTLIDVQQQGTVYYLTYGTSNGYQLSPQVMYVIDTNLHSLLNPVRIQDFINRKDTIIKNLRTYQF